MSDEPTSTELSYFYVLLGTDIFVDKTLMISSVLQPPENILITCPRRFGKSTNLDMLRRFFSVAEYQLSKFESTNIYNVPSAMEHAGMYAVVWIDLSWFTVTISSLEKLIVALRQIIHRTFLQYEFLCTSPKLNDREREVCVAWCLHHKTMDEDDVGCGISNLVRYLYKHYDGKKVIVLVDEFDAIVHDAMVEVEQLELDKIIRYYYKLFSLVIKTEKSECSPYVFKTIFTGISSITCTGPSPLNNVKKFKFLQNEKFVKFYGILESEFDGLLKKSVFKQKNREEAMRFYNGYAHRTCKILNTYSITQYLTGESVLCSESEGWCKVGAVHGFDALWEREETQVLLQDLILNKFVPFWEIDVILPRHLITVKRILLCDQSILQEINIIFAYLKQLGYFQTVMTISGELSIEIPNEEIRMLFKSILQTSFERKYNFKEIQIRHCGELWNKLAENLGEIKDIFEKLRKSLEDAVRDSLVLQFLNETSFEHLVFSTILKTRLSPVSQVRVKEMKDNREAHKLDLCFDTKDFLVMLENKFGRNTSATSALTTIADKKYTDILKKEQFTKIKNCIFVGIHMSEEGSISLAYAVNDENCKNIVVVE